MPSETTTPVTRRHEFVLFFDVTNGNPNGDPDAGNLPRLDPETNQGLTSDVCLKRKVRNYVALARPEAPGHEIYMRDGATLNTEHKRAYTALAPEITKAEDLKKGPKDDGKARELTRWMCANFYDIRTFGAVMTTQVNAGQVRGPVQIAFGRSVEPIVPLEVSITRLAATTEQDADAKGGRPMGRKHIVPYGLYRVHGFVSAPLASHPIKGTGFSEADLELFWEALGNMFEHDRSAARGEMASRKLVVFRHASALGSAHAHVLFERVKTWRVHRGSRQPIGSDATDNWPPARAFDDYAITVDRAGLPDGVEVIEREHSLPMPVLADAETEDGLVPISALQHHLFCPRQCALIHVERIWLEDAATAEGRLLHERVDAAAGESRPGVRIARSLQLRSLALGVAGRADVVEFRGEPPQPYPVEYKRGRPKLHRADEVQLCAQAICLEEMFATTIDEGALFYGAIRRRVPVAFDPALRALTALVAGRVREMIATHRTPPPIRMSGCERCSLRDRCCPDRLEKPPRVATWLARQLAS